MQGCKPSQHVAEVQPDNASAGLFNVRAVLCATSCSSVAAPWPLALHAMLALRVELGSKCGRLPISTAACMLVPAPTLPRSLQACLRQVGQGAVIA
jgi:hypothetical protein